MADRGRSEDCLESRAQRRKEALDALAAVEDPIWFISASIIPFPSNRNVRGIRSSTNIYDATYIYDALNSKFSRSKVA